MTYGAAVTGVSDSMLYAQRVTAAAAAAPGRGTAGQDLDIGLLLADEGTNAKADPAYDAHLLPIGEWAMAVWENWMPEASMERIITHGRERLNTATNKWAATHGPGAALASSARAKD